MSNANTNQVNPTRLPKSKLSASVIDEIERIGTFLGSLESHFDQASNLAELGVFSSMFAHEVNNLMTQVGGRAQLALMNMDQPEMIVRALELACHASTQIAQLSEIFLESANADSPHADQYSVCDIHERAIEFIADEDIKAYGITLDVGSSDHKISIPPILLQQVLLNLYLNAIRAIEESPAQNDARITTRIDKVDIGGNCSPWNTPRIRITVEDTGIGMSEQQIEQVFESWNRQESNAHRSNQPSKADADRERGRGHGLGLAVCKKLLSQADGTIHVESTPGIGTKMIIILPDASQTERTQAA